MCCPCPSDLCPVAPWGCGNPPSQSWQKRLKAEFVLCIQDPLYTDGWGRRWLCSPHGQGCSDFSGPHHPSKPQTCTHTHTHLGRGSQGAGGQEKEKKVSVSPKPCLSFGEKPLGQEVCYCLAAVGSTEVPSAPCPMSRFSPPGTAPSALNALPALFQLNFCFP